MPILNMPSRVTTQSITCPKCQARTNCLIYPDGQVECGMCSKLLPAKFVNDPNNWKK
jgi:ribosomal protein S27E